MLHRPAFKPYFHVEVVDGEGTFLLSEHGHHVLFGEPNALVAAAIDGRRTADEIVDSLVDRATMEELYLSLATLECDGFLVEADPDAEPAEAAYWAGLGVDSRVARERVVQSTVALRAATGAVPEGAAEALERAGLKPAAPEQQRAAAVSLVVSDDYLRPELEALNAEHLAAARPWMLVKPAGAYAWLGPIFVPGRTACWQCLAQRLRGNREVENLIERRGRPGPFPLARAAMSGTVAVAVELAALHLRMFLSAGGASGLTSRLMTSNWATFDVREHPVLRRPQCPACGDPTLAQNSDEVQLPRPTGPVQRADGGLRNTPPAQTFARYAHLVGPLTGVVRDVTPVDTGDSPLHVFNAGHNFALKNDSLYFLHDGLRTHSGGKGRTREQARTSALCEAIERYCGVFRGDERRVRARLGDLEGRGVHPNDCMLFSATQLREREAWLARQTRFHTVPVPFPEGAEIEWTPARSLVGGGETRYLPTGYVYYGYPYEPETMYFWADSNGNAAGNTLEEAQLQGFLELVERDAVAVWWYNRVQRPAVDLSSLADPWVDELLAYYATLGRELWVLDLTNDLGIPAFVACSRRTAHTTEDIILGFGAHLDARTGLQRAITELNQFMPSVLRHNPDGSTAYASDDRDTLAWWQHATLANQPYLMPLAGPPRRIADLPSLSSGDSGQDVATCVRIAAAAGHETLVVNQTRPDVGLPVVKVLVPGLRHFWARYAPGRLYDVPVRMGWLPAPLAEAQLNPIPMFV